MSRVPRRIIAVLCAVLLACGMNGGLPCRAMAQEPTSPQEEDVLRKNTLEAITRSQQYLVSKQLADGRWPHVSHPVGATALVLMSLLYSGVSPDDPHVRRGLDYMRREPNPENVYDVALSIMAYTLAGDAQDRGRIRSYADWLIEAQHTDKEPGPGAWGYEMLDRGHWDNSNSQFALLGLREAAIARCKDVPREVWQKAQDHWMKHHAGAADSPTGVYWYYNDSARSASANMTVAGISSLSITSSFLQHDGDVGPDGQIDCCAVRDDEQVSRLIEGGMRWLSRDGVFSVRGSRKAGQTWRLYDLYSLERAGRFTGHRFLGDQDWFRMGVRHLLSLQGPRDGAWFDLTSNNDPGVGTSLALLFLSKGNSPVLINKLQYGDADRKLYGRGWNRHPRDIANLTDYISTQPQWPNLLSWQVVDLAKAARDQDGAGLLHAKVQYLTGDGPLDTISDAEVQLLREYINQGGFLFAVNTCGGQAFDDGLRDLVRRMFPEGSFSLERLPPTHDVYRSENLFSAADGAPVPELWGVDVGCRTAIIYSPDDHACRWNKWMRFDPPQRQTAVKTQIRRSMTLASNIIAYATGRELLDALTEPERLARVDPNDTTRGKLQIARLRHAGGWDTAPNSLRHLQLGLKAAGITASSISPTLPATDPELFDYPIVYMHGRNNFRLTDAEQKQLRSYLDQGGFLFADASCGSPSFDQSFRELVRQMFGRDLEAIPFEHELFNSPLAHDIRQVRRRLPLDVRSGSPIQAEYTTGAPVLEAIRDESGRFVLIYSKYDLSCALERQTTVSCAGYASEDAARIATNIVIHALSQ